MMHLKSEKDIYILSSYFYDRPLSFQLSTREFKVSQKLKINLILKKQMQIPFYNSYFIVKKFPIKRPLHFTDKNKKICSNVQICVQICIILIVNILTAEINCGRPF